MRSGEWDFVSLYMFCVALSMDMPALCVACPTVSTNFLVKQFAICLGVFLLLLSVVYRIDHARSSKECVRCARGPSERPDAPSICFVCVFVCRKLSPHLGV